MVIKSKLLIFLTKKNQICKRDMFFQNGSLKVENWVNRAVMLFSAHVIESLWILCLIQNGSYSRLILQSQSESWEQNLHNYIAWPPCGWSTSVRNSIFSPAPAQGQWSYSMCCGCISWPCWDIVHRTNWQTSRYGGWRGK